MGLRKNIILKRSVILSMIIFSMLITAGIFLIFKSSFRRDTLHLNLVSLTGNIQDNIYKSGMILQDIILEQSADTSGLFLTIDSLNYDLMALEILINEKRSIRGGDQLWEFQVHYGRVRDDLRAFTERLVTTNFGEAGPDSTLLQSFHQFNSSFRLFQSILPQFLLIDNHLYKREIIAIVTLNFLIVLLAGFLILRLTNQLIDADRTLIRKTIEVENRERERIAADLHDGLGSLLSGLIIYIQVMEKENEHDPERKEKLHHLNFIANNALQSIEEVINNLNPSLLTKYGLIQSLERICERINKLGKTQFFVDTRKLMISIPESLELTLYRICSELINNALKHSSAGKAEFIFFSQKKQVHMIYWDDGVGFEPGFSGFEEQKSGLSNLVRRVESIEGSCKITSKPNEGVKIEIIFEIGEA
ncbi:MAG: hypothetical protein IH594_04115 [Bacteroidales bacterium]|nr:hypothetical protein [Bacteroidales bacterium]